MKVVIIDDQEHASGRIGLSLTSINGAKVLRLTTPEQAISLMDFEYSADLFLIDLRFGRDDSLETTGLGICQKIRSALPEAVIIGYSSLFDADPESHKDIRAKFVEMGADRVCALSDLTLLNTNSFRSDFIQLRAERKEKATGTAKPSVFLGSSIEKITVANKIQEQLHYDLDIHIWNQTVFGVGDVTIDRLEQAVKEYEYSIFVLTRDDLVIYRDEEYDAPRDNVIFEAGLFIGQLGRERTFLVTDNSRAAERKFKMPSDLAGVTTARFDAEANHLASELGPACQQIREAVERTLGLC